ncbi:unnamed protein product [Ixodes persulcatus]
MAALVSSEKAGLSFKFTKTVESKKLLENDKIIENPEETAEKDYVLSVDGSVVKSTLPKAEKKQLVIPLIKNNIWRVPKAQKQEEKNSTESPKLPENAADLTLEQQAIKEIIADSTGQTVQSSAAGDGEELNIPLLVQNKVPEGFETDEKVDVSLRAEEPSQEDYESVPIEEYGLAMLRGMGWHPGKPIGARCTEVAKPIEAVLRPRGLGLGAESKLSKPPPLVAKEEGDLVLRRGAYVRIEQGQYKDMYGQVEGLDDDNGRVIVKLALGGSAATVNESFITLVNKKEYARDGKLLNKSKYDEYKRKHEPQEEEVQERSDREKHSSRKKQKLVENGRESSRSSKDSSKRRERSRSPKPKEQFWLRPQIRVRFVDKRYQNGRYYNTKMTIEDVTSKTTCMCNTEDGKILEDVKASMLETVIPRKTPSYVLVLLGSRCGQVGLVLKRDRDRCCATVQMLYDKEVMNFDYDSISEYVGDTSYHD